MSLPGGDGETLRAVACSWDAMGTGLTAAVKAIDREVDALDEQDWHGSARQAFQRHWNGEKASLDDAAKNFHSVARGLREYAQEIDNINESIIDICLQIAEMEVAGVALSFFTGFISDLVANTAVAERVAKVVDLVKLFTTAAEKVGALLERFGGVSERVSAVLVRFASKAAEVVKTTAESYATNYVTNVGSSMANQAVSAKSVDVGDDLQEGARTAAESTVLTGVAGGVGEGFHVTGAAGRILRDEGMLGTTVNGAVGGAASSAFDGYVTGKKGDDIAWDAGQGFVSGAVGNSQNEAITQRLEGHNLGGENLSDRGRLADAAFKNTVDTIMGTGVSAAGAAVENDLKEGVDDK